MKIMVDSSLSLINRTGAHYIAQELIASCGEHFSSVRQWRLMNRGAPQGLARKLIGRLMLRELTFLRGRSALPWPDPDFRDLLRLFLDPLYVLRSNLARTDIVLCHDVGPLTHGFLFPEKVVELYRAAYQKLAKAQPGIVFVSNTTKDAFVRLFGCEFRFLRVIPLYVRAAAADGETRKLADVDAPYILTVGALERRKNQIASIAAYREAGLAAEGIQYVLCGPRGDGAAAILDEARRTPGVKVLGYLEDAELRWLYRNALAFVLPSLLEGFGMPALEAASYGVIPIISRDSALEEAVGGLGIAVDPLSPHEIARALGHVCGMSSADRQGYVTALQAHARTYSAARFRREWDTLLSAESAQELLSSDAPLGACARQGVL